jgi:hypothetical protein
MASTYSTNLGIELITTGEQANTWGATTNTNLGTLIEQAISGYTTQAITDGADTVITIPSGASGVARNMYIQLSGALTAARNLIVPPNRKLYFIYNNTTGGYAVTVKVSGLTGVSVPNGVKALLVCNGTDIVNAVDYFASLTTGAFTATGTFTLTGAVNLSPANANVTISPTGTGTVTVNPATAGTLNNIAIGGVTPLAGAFTTLTVSGATVPANGVYLPSANTLAFSSNTTFRGSVNANGAWNLAAPAAGNVTLTVNAVAGTHSIKIADTNNASYDAGYLGIPQNAQTSAYAPTLQDRGKHISITTGGVTINANPFTYGTTGATTWTAGDTFLVVNNSGSSQTITAGGSVTFRLGGTATTGNRTVAQYGTASCLCLVGGATPTFIISGAGVT